MGVVKDGLVGYWHFDDGFTGSSWNNIAPNTVGKYNGTVYGAVKGTDGILFSKAEGRYVSIPKMDVQDISDIFEYEVYLKSPFTDVSESQGVVGSLIMNNSTLQIEGSPVGVGGDGSYIMASGNDFTMTLPKNTFFKLNFIFNKTTGVEKAYFNNQIKIDGISAVIKSPSDMQIWIGGLNSLGNHLTGTIASVKVYNRELTSEERQQNLDNGMNVGLESPPPTDIVTAQVAEVQKDSVSLSWTYVDDGTFSFIRIYRNGVMIIELPIGTTTFVDEGLSPDTNYNYTIKTANADGVESEGQTLMATTLQAEASNYLIMDGNNSYLQLPSLGFDEIIMDCLVANESLQTNTYNGYHILIDTRTGANEWVYSGTASDGVSLGWQGVYVNDQLITSYTQIPRDSRFVIKALISDTTDDVTIFSRYNITGYAVGEIYNITMRLNGTTVASYDMSTGTVEDQSGNENHATLYGGSWANLGQIDTTPPSEISNLSENHGENTVNLSWGNPLDSDFSHCNIYRDGVLIGTSSNGYYQDDGLSPLTTYIYNITTVDEYNNESQGSSIQVTTSESVLPAEVTVVSTSRVKISDEIGMDRASIVFKFNVDIKAWEVRVNGSGQGTGVLADSGGSAIANAEITAEVDWTELQQEGQNRINIYGQNINGEWTPYVADGEQEPIIINTYGRRRYGTTYYGRE